VQVVGKWLTRSPKFGRLTTQQKIHRFSREMIAVR
jgi:hypothetical protein